MLFSFEEIKRKLTKGRKPKAHEPSNHSLQRLKRKRQAVKTVVGELTLYVPDSSMLIYHASFFMNLGCKPVRITLCTRMSWACCSVCASRLVSVRSHDRGRIMIVAKGPAMSEPLMYLDCT